jgi:hypothetical protein
MNNSSNIKAAKNILKNHNKTIGLLILLMFSMGLLWSSK